MHFLPCIIAHFAEPHLRPLGNAQLATGLCYNTFSGQIPEANQIIERQEVALQKQVHMTTAM